MKKTISIRGVILILAFLSLFAAIYLFISPPTVVAKYTVRACITEMCDIPTGKAMANYTPAYVALLASAVLYVVFAAAHIPNAKQ